MDLRPIHLHIPSTPTLTFTDGATLIAPRKPERRIDGKPGYEVIINGSPDPSPHFTTVLNKINNTYGKKGTLTSPENGGYGVPSQMSFVFRTKKQASEFHKSLLKRFKDATGNKDAQIKKMEPDTGRPGQLFSQVA